MGLEVVESSAKTNVGVNEVFGTIAALMIKKKNQEMSDNAVYGGNGGAGAMGGSGSGSDSRVLIDGSNGGGKKDGCC